MLDFDNLHVNVPNTERKEENVTTPTVNTVAKPVSVRKKLKKNEDHPLAHLIPPYHFYEDYVSRNFPGGHTDLDLFLVAKADQVNVSLVGDTGTGKTSSVLAYCAKNRLPLVTIHCNGGVDPSTLFSRTEADERGLYHTLPTDATIALEVGDCVFYLDEDNFLVPRIAAVFHGGLDKRRQMYIPELNRTINIPSTLQFISSHNDGYEGTRRQNEAFANRWAMQLQYEYDRAQEEKIVTGIPSLLDLAERLRAQRNSGELETPIGVNLLLEFEQFAWSLGVEFAISNFVAHFQVHERAAIGNVLDHFVSQIQAERDAGVAAEKEQA